MKRSPAGYDSLGGEYKLFPLLLDTLKYFRKKISVSAHCGIIKNIFPE